MLKLLKYEIDYYKIPLSMIVFFMLIFSIYTLFDISVFRNTIFLSEYFWTIFVALGTYTVIFAIWTRRAKEKRERMHYLIPISKKQINLTRWFLGVIPVLILFIGLITISIFISIDQGVFVERILVQFGLFIIFLATFDLTLNLENFLKSKSVVNCSLITTVITFFVALISLGLIYCTTLYTEDTFAKYIFNFWAIIIYTGSVYFNYKKQNFVNG